MRFAPAVKEVTDPSTDETIVSHCNNTIHKNASTSPSLQPKNSLNIQNSDNNKKNITRTNYGVDVYNNGNHSNDNIEQIDSLPPCPTRRHSSTHHSHYPHHHDHHQLHHSEYLQHPPHDQQHILSDQYTVSSSYAYSNKTDEDINDCVTSQQVSSISSCKHNQFDNLEHSTTTDSIHQYHRIQTASPAIDVNDNYALNIENNITKSLKQNLHRTDEIQQSFNEILAKNHNRQTMITPTTSTSPESSMTNQSLLEKSIIGNRNSNKIKKHEDKLKRRIISLNKEVSFF
ncbi:unnamed protein product [Trichobilharzia regenti]|nr:unnamed protein product [Trichobilharzia regenti]